METMISKYKDLLISLISGPQLAFDDRLYGLLPTGGGVYRIFEKGATWESSIHVGETGNLRQRIYRNHYMGNRRASIMKKKLIESGRFGDEAAVKQYLRNRCLVQYIEIPDESLRKFFEHFAISILKPRY